MNAKAKEEKEEKNGPTSMLLPLGEESYGPTSLLLPAREESSYSAFGFIDDMK
jgi:hypothetical protein